MADKQIISQVEIYKLRIPLIEPFITSLAYETHVENVIVVIRTEKGTTGFGECNLLKSPVPCIVLFWIV